MKNLQAIQNNKKFSLRLNVVVVFLYTIVFAAVFLPLPAAYAQAPHITYTSPQVYDANTAISPLSPTNTGGAVPAPTPVALGRATDITGIGVDAKGNVYIGSPYTLEIVEFPAAGGNPIVLASGVKPVGMAVDAAGDVYFGKQNNSICEINAGTRDPGTIITGQAEPVGFAIDSAGNLYYSEQAHGDIKELPAGSTTPVVIATGFNQPQGIAVDIAGNIYVADAGNSAVKKVQAGSRTITTLTAGSGSTGVFGVAVDAFGNVYFVNINNTTVTEIPVGGGSNVVVSSEFLNTIAIAVDGKGNLYIANTNEDGGNTNTNYVQELPAGGYTISPLPPAGISLSTRTGVISGTPTAASPATNYTVTATNSSGSSMATVNIKVQAGTNKSLSGLTINHGVLSPAFNTATTAYAVSVANGISTVSLTPTTSNSTATVTVNGTAVASGSASAAIPLSIGANPIQVKVDSATTESVYTVTVTRASSNIANLTALKISKGTLSPTFNSATTSYTSSVAAGVTSMTVTPTDPTAGTSITVNGTAVASGTASPAINLVAGQNTISIVVTASDGTTTKTYTLTVTCPGSTNDNLSSLKISRGTLSPAFTTNTTSYTASVVNGVTSMTVTPTTSASNATVTVNGTAVTSGEASGPITLFVGDNTITTVVTAFGGSATKTYTIMVTRASGSANNFYQPIDVGVQNFEPLRYDDGVMVHQAVSPNGDGINDFLIIDNINQYPDNKLTILNRSGQLIYQATGYDNSSKVFDGHSNKNGQMQLPGTYFYELDYTVKGISKTKTGFIVLKY